ncbi:hypothetical protein [Hyphomonas sp.]|uniref:hypothetical protein n=1 Tax=Hyphomonas sp. TaxID=87 RepID=UPI00391B28D3
MRPIPILASLVILASAASADQIILEKGEWTMTSDFYLTIEEGGRLLDEESDSETVTECWRLDEEVVIDESMVVSPDCRVLDRGSVRTDYLIELQMVCVIDGLDMDGAILMTTNKARNMLSARYWLKSADYSTTVRSDGIIMGRRNGAC